MRLWGDLCLHQTDTTDEGGTKTPPQQHRIEGSASTCWLAAAFVFVWNKATDTWRTEALWGGYSVFVRSPSRHLNAAHCGHAVWPVRNPADYPEKVCAMQRQGACPLC